MSRLDRTLDNVVKMALDKSEDNLIATGATEIEIARELNHQLAILATWRGEVEKELARFLVGAPRKVQ